jgi:hypothetical protein
MTETHPFQTVSDVIRNARAIQKMNTRDFGATVGVSHTMIAHYENAKYEPSDEQLRDWLFGTTAWISNMALEIYVVRYRALLKAGLPQSSTQAA